MTDLEIIKKNFNIITESEGYDYWYELEKEALDAANRMAAEIERLKAEIIEANKKAKDQGRTACNLFDELKKLQKENRELEAAHAEIESLKNEVNETQVVYYSVLKENKQLKDALAEKPDIVRCGECEHYEPEVEVTSIVPLSPPDYEPPLCKWFNFPTNKNDFCSFGRKEAKDED